MGHLLIFTRAKMEEEGDFLKNGYRILEPQAPSEEETVNFVRKGSLNQRTKQVTPRPRRRNISADKGGTMWGQSN